MVTEQRYIKTYNVRTQSNNIVEIIYLNLIQAQIN